MKLLLVNPSRFWVDGWGPPTQGPLFTLFAWVRHRLPSIRVEALDLEHELGRADTAEQVAAFIALARVALASKDFDVVGVSCWTSLHLLASVTVANLCKELNPDCTVVVGGHHPTAAPEDFRYPGSPFDVVVRGPGEGPLVRVLTEPDPPALITGEPVEDHDVSLPWEAFPYFRGARHLPLLLSRGCPFGCHFCVDRGSRWRARSPAHALAEIARVRQLLPQVEVLNIADPLFGGQRAWRRAFLRGLPAVTGELRLWAETRVDLLDAEDARLLEGLPFRLDLGLDAATPHMARTLGKSGHPTRYLEHFAAVADAFERHRVPALAYLIVGHPEETDEDRDATWAFAQAMYALGDRHVRLSAQLYKRFPGEEGERWWRLAGPDMATRASAAGPEASVLASRVNTLAIAHTPALEDDWGQDAQDRLAALADDRLEPPPLGGPAATMLQLDTPLGPLRLRVDRDGPRLGALVRGGWFTGVRVERAVPGLFLALGPRDRRPWPPRRPPRDDRPTARGAVLMGEHPHRLLICRGRWPAMDGHVIGHLVAGWEALDGLVAGDPIHNAQVLG